MVGLLFYFFYATLIFLSLWLFLSKTIYVLYPIILTAQFNVTAFLKVGLTISFFEVSLFLIAFATIVYHSSNLKGYIKNLSISTIDFIWLLFLIIGIVSVVISFIRITTFDLQPDPFIDSNPLVRSFMSLNKFFVYIPLIFIIRQHLTLFYAKEDINRVFLKAMVWGGIIPCLAVVIQFTGIGFYLIHNNPSFSETFRLENYLGGRPVGLTNEASFFVYQLFFSNLCLFACLRKGYLSKIFGYSTAALFLVCVLLSISRLGQLMFALFYLVSFFKAYNIFTIKGFFKIALIIPIILVALWGISRLSIDGFNVGQRFTSTFNIEADLSTIERYGSAEALLNMFLDKSVFFGIGIYNFQYYIKDYLPAYMDVIYYPRGAHPASFNFVLQLAVEFGGFIFILFLSVTFLLLRRVKDMFVSDWFLYLLLFSLSFQTLNFSLPFLILFFLLPDEKSFIHN